MSWYTGTARPSVSNTCTHGLETVAGHQHRIDRQFFAAAAQGFGDGGVDAESEFGCALPAEVAFRFLINV